MEQALILKLRHDSYPNFNYTDRSGDPLTYSKLGGEPDLGRLCSQASIRWLTCT